MESIALTIHNDKIRQEIFDFLKKFPTDELELMPIEDAEDLQLLQKTRHEETISFSDYLNNAD
ncbi:MAG: hypothetical protein WAV07_16995 [Candidatus Contendobacter sp.]